MNGWLRTSARIVITSHDVQLYKKTDSYFSKRAVEVVWPDGKYMAATIEDGGTAVGWLWKLWNGWTGKATRGVAKNEAGARAAVMRRVRDYVDEVRSIHLAALEDKALVPFIADGYSRSKPVPVSRAEAA